MRRAYRPMRRHLGDVGLLSAADIATFAANAGFSGPDLATAVAIALAESFPSGNPNSYNPETQAGAPQGKGSFGLWQIYLNKHPEFAGWNLFDPQQNANAAYSIYSRRGGFSDWSTYNSGAYQNFLSAVTTPAPLTIDASTGLPIDDSTPTPQLTAAQASVFPSAPKFPTGILGLAAAGIGLYLVLEDVLS